MLSGQIGRYKYYELSDIYDSMGCTLCRSRTNWSVSLFQKDFEKEQHELCVHCPIFMALKLSKLYAQKLNEYEEVYLDDGK